MVWTEGYVAAVAATDELAGSQESHDESSPVRQFLDLTDGVPGWSPEVVELHPTGPLIPTLDKGTLKVFGSLPYV